MSLNVHVLIATNKGLVAIQSITDLQDSALQSVITINGSTDLATISPSYHRFIQKSTGLIQSEFGGSSFRANISRNIDVGNSWQLAFYIAHFIQARAMPINTHIDKLDQGVQGQIVLGYGTPNSGDIVLVATGQLNTSTGAVEAVSHIAEKCITASAQIKLWMKKGVLVEFFVPAKTEALKLLPQLDCSVYKVIDTAQLKDHVTQLLPLSIATAEKSPVLGADSVNKINKNAFDENPVSAPIDLSVVFNQDAKHAEPAKPSDRPSALPLRRVVAAVVVITLIAVTYWALNTSLFKSAALQNHTRFVILTKNGLHCDANAIEQVTAIAQQYVSRMPSVTFASACSISLISAKQIPQVWLVADSKTLIELSSMTVDDQFHWPVPLPTQQQVDREYILIITEQYLDLADLAAFKAFLSRLESTQKPSVEILAPFFAQIGVNPQYLSQKLVASAK